MSKNFFRNERLALNQKFKKNSILINKQNNGPFYESIEIGLQDKRGIRSRDLLREKKRVYGLKVGGYKKGKREHLRNFDLFFFVLFSVQKFKAHQNPAAFSYQNIKMNFKSICFS